MKKNLILFLTHNFNKIFINTLEKINNIYNDSDVIVLFDNSKTYDETLVQHLNNIKIIKINRIQTSYDKLGHSLYINYFRNNPEILDNYKYFWIIENDVYYPKSFKDFIDQHDMFENDLFVSEYGTRSNKWTRINSLKGFKRIFNIGILAVMMRLSSKLMKLLIITIDKQFKGYLEAILPHLCIEHNMIIQQFMPELCGILTTDNKNAFLKLIEYDILNKQNIFLENKIYHPIKL